MIDERRKFLALAAIAPFALLTAAKPANFTAKVCFDPKTLPLSQKNQRRGIGYVVKSTDPQQRCATCSFFTASTEGCGTCQMLSGGPVDAAGVCTSFARKT
jgi:High potential iron-sulfur protein